MNKDLYSLKSFFSATKTAFLITISGTALLATDVNAKQYKSYGKEASMMCTDVFGVECINSGTQYVTYSTLRFSESIFNVTSGKNETMSGFLYLNILQSDSMRFGGCQIELTQLNITKDLESGYALGTGIIEWFKYTNEQGNQYDITENINIECEFTGTGGKNTGKHIERIIQPNPDGSLINSKHIAEGTSADAQGSCLITGNNGTDIYITSDDSILADWKEKHSYH